MVNSSRKFRVKVFGGFNRKDVSDYLVAEIREREALKKDIDRLTEAGEMTAAAFDPVPGLEAHIARLEAEKNEVEERLRDAKVVESELRLYCDLRIAALSEEYERRIGDLSETLKTSEETLLVSQTRYKELADKLKSIQQVIEQ